MIKRITGGILMTLAIVANAAALTPKETAIVDIGAAVARGEHPGSISGPSGP